MGLTKQYLAYRAVDNFNIISSGRSNVNFLVYNNIEGKELIKIDFANLINKNFCLRSICCNCRSGKCFDMGLTFGSKGGSS